MPSLTFVVAPAKSEDKGHCEMSMESGKISMEGLLCSSMSVILRHCSYKHAVWTIIGHNVVVHSSVRFCGIHIIQALYELVAMRCVSWVFIFCGSRPCLHTHIGHTSFATRLLFPAPSGVMFSQNVSCFRLRTSGYVIFLLGP